MTREQELKEAVEYSKQLIGTYFLFKPEMMDEFRKHLLVLLQVGQSHLSASTELPERFDHLGEVRQIFKGLTNYTKEYQIGFMEGSNEMLYQVTPVLAKALAEIEEKDKRIAELEKEQEKLCEANQAHIDRLLIELAQKDENHLVVVNKKLQSELSQLKKRGEVIRFFVLPSERIRCHVCPDDISNAWANIAIHADHQEAYCEKCYSKQSQI